MSYRGVTVGLLINIRDLEEPDVGKKGATKGIYHHPGQAMDWHKTERTGACSRFPYCIPHPSYKAAVCQKVTEI